MLNEACVLWKGLYWPLSNRETILHQMDLIKWKFVFTNVSWSVKQWKRGVWIFVLFHLGYAKRNYLRNFSPLANLTGEIGHSFPFLTDQAIPFRGNLNHLLKPFFLSSPHVKRTFLFSNKDLFTTSLCPFFSWRCCLEGQTAPIFFLILAFILHVQTETLSHQCLWSILSSLFPQSFFAPFQSTFISFDHGWAAFLSQSIQMPWNEEYS